MSVLTGTKQWRKSISSFTAASADTMSKAIDRSTPAAVTKKRVRDPRLSDPRLAANIRNASLSSGTDKKRSILRPVTSSKTPSRPVVRSQPQSAEEKQCDYNKIMQKVSAKLSSSSSTSVSVNLLSAFLLDSYQVHEERVILAWLNGLRSFDRSGSGAFPFNLQDKILATFYGLNDALANAHETFDRLAVDIAAIAPSAFFYAGLIGTDATHEKLRRIMSIWMDRHWFTEQFIRLFANSLDEGRFFGNKAGRNGNFDYSRLWDDRDFQSYLNSRYTYLTGNKQRIRDSVSKRPDAYKKVRVLHTELKPFTDAPKAKIVKNMKKINDIVESAERCYCLLRTISNEENMYRAVAILVTTLVRLVVPSIKSISAQFR